MSTLVSKNVQIGADATATNNFTIYQPATPNGTLLIGNGNTGITSSLVALTSSGNLGLGVTPSAWNSNYRALDVGGVAAVTSYLYTDLWYNAYINSGGTAIYKNGGYGASRFSQDNGAFKFFTAPSGTAGNAITFTQAMTLDASGNLGVGQTPTTSINQVAGTTIASSGYMQIQRSAANPFALARFGSSAGTITEFYYNATSVGSISVTASITSYNVTSDERLKENIQDAAPASALIDAIQVRQYDWKADGSHQRYGFIAQELVAVAPEAVYQPTNPDDMMAVDYSKLVPMLVKEIQSLRQRLAALEAA